MSGGVPVNDDDAPPIVAEGMASLDISENGDRVETNTPLRISVGDAAVWEARREVVISDHPEVKRWARKALYASRPDPTPRPVMPVPKPKGKRRGVSGVPCPACRGAGERYDYEMGERVTCQECHGTRHVTSIAAEMWRERNDEME